jgi:hypothetical protein
MTLNLDDAVWTARARRYESFECDAVFNIVYIVSSDRAPGQDPMPPAAPEKRPAARVIGHEAALIEHYRRVIAAVSAHGDATRLDRPFPAFSIQPAILIEGEVFTSFTWTDDIDETREILRAFAESRPHSPGVVWDDVEQGWAIRVVSEGEWTFLIEWDWEHDDDPQDAIAMRTVDLAAQAQAALDRLDALHRHLIDAFGRDYWTYRPAPNVEAEPRRSWFGRLLARLFG